MHSINRLTRVFCIFAVIWTARKIPFLHSQNICRLMTILCRLIICLKQDERKKSFITYTHTLGKYYESHFYLANVQDCNFGQLGITIIIFMNDQTNHMNTIQSRITDTIWCGWKSCWPTKRKKIQQQRSRLVMCAKTKAKSNVVRTVHMKRLRCPHQRTQMYAPLPIHVSWYFPCLDYIGPAHKNKMPMKLNEAEVAASD